MTLDDLPGDPAADSFPPARHVLSTPRHHRRRRPRALGAMTAVVGLTTTSVLVAVAGQATSAPVVSKALQAVSVSLSPSGQLTAVRTTDVTEAVDGTFQTRKRTVDPASAAGKLPVIASVSYVHDGKAGTDLRDLEGVSGQVEVDVTLTNTTGRSVVLGTSNGRKTFGQVTTPLTVVGSATVPTKSFSALVQSPNGAPADHTTNGLVSTDGARTAVQWASVLAPPRLSGSATFRLVETATKFVLPEITLHVSPGLTGDPSLQQTFDQAFGSSSPILQLENSTAGLITLVNRTLVQVQGILGGVREDLVTASQSTGTQAKASLQATGASASSRLQSLSSLLVQLDASLRSALQAAGQTGDQGLQDTLEKVIKTLGLPDHRPAATPAGGALPTAVPTAVPGACSALDPTASATATLWDQIVQVTAALDRAAAVSAGCVTDAQQALVASIGKAGSCAQADASLYCRLGSAQTDLAARRSTLAAQGADVLGALADTGLGGIGTAITAAQAAVLKVQTDVLALKAVKGSPGALRAVLTSVSDALGSTLASLDPNAGSGLGHELAGLHTAAVGARAALGSAADAADADTTRGALAAVTAQVCTLPALTDPQDQQAVRGYADTVRDLIDGGTCASGAPHAATSGKDLAARLDADAAAWDKVVSLTDVTGASGVGAELTSLITSLTATKAVADAGLTDTSKKSQELLDAIDTLTTDAGALYDDRHDDGVDGRSCTALSPATTPLNAIESTFNAVVCKQGLATAGLTSLVASTDAALSAADKSLAGTEAAADSARTAASAQLSDLLSRLSGRLTDAAQTQRSSSYALLSSQVADVTKQVTTARAGLTTGVAALLASATRDLTSDRTANDTNLADLQQGLDAVVKALGTPGQGGLLGQILDNGNTVDAQGVQAIQAISGTASGFRSVRLTDAAALAVQRQQYEAGLAQVGQTPYLGADLPGSTTHASAYTFHLAGGA